jgi:hypothetical protein
MDVISSIKLHAKSFWKEYTDYTGLSRSIVCPFTSWPDRHPEGKDKSFKIYDDGTFKCFGGTCNAHGDIINFYSIYHGVDNQRAIKELSLKFGIVKPLPNNRVRDVDDAHRYLLGNDAILNRLLNERGITREIIQRYRIGYNNKRLVTPIIINGKTINRNRHDIFKELRKFGENKSIWERGVPIHPFPYDNINKDNLVLCEGIPDTLFAIAIFEDAEYYPITFGGTNIPDEYISYLSNKNIFMFFDNGLAGEEGVANLLNKLKQPIKRINFPEGDLTEYFIKVPQFERHPVMLKLIDSASTMDYIEKKILYKKVAFDDIDNYFNENIEVNVTITGVDSHPYIYPSKLLVECTPDMNETCTNCNISKFGGKLELDIDSVDIIRLINVTEKQKFTEIKRIIGAFCDNIIVKEQNEKGIFEIGFVEEVGEKSINKAYKSGFVALDKIKTNTVYTLRGVSAVIPSSQKLTFIFIEAVPRESELDTFVMDTNTAKKLNSLFNGNTPCIDKLATDLEQHVVKRWQRKDIIIATLMTMFSGLQIIFNDTSGRPSRGWVEILLIGDSGTAKTTTVEPVMKHFNVGSTIIGEHMTAAGLIGAMSRLGTGTKCLIWGALPRNDRGMVLLDEVHDPKCEDVLGSMTSVRSKGVASKTVEGGTRTTSCRVRVVFAANPKKGKVGDDMFPIRLVKQIFTSQEDVARLDMVVMLSDSEVNTETIHIVDNYDNNPRYTAELCNKLITWVWSRKPEQIIIDDKITKFILKKSQEMIKLYGGTDIGIVHESRFKDKLARMSVAVAAMTFSHDSEYNIIVKEQHVKYVIWFLHKIYNKPMCNYREYVKSLNFEDVSYTMKKL